MQAGCRAAEVLDEIQGAPVPLWFLYPTEAPARVERFGPYGLEVAMGAPVAGEHRPLVILSHGGGGTPWVYRDLAASLAREGFVVVLPEHPGNCRRDNRLEGTPANLENRPRHLRLALDAAFASADLAPHLVPDRAAVIGHSMGGYTALALAGGRPSALPNETPDGLAHPVATAPDARVKSLVLLAPATPWFMAEGALGGVDLPVLIWTGDRDEISPDFYADIVRRGVRDAAKVDHRIAAGAGHFSFLSPFPPAMTGPHVPASQDPPGFDRVAFFPALLAGILGFLRAPR
jgi:predicted dienelactone hydrolase